MVLRALGHHITESDIADYGKQFSTGKATYPQFKDLISKRPQPTDNEDRIKEAFKVFDKSGTGQIEIVELRHVLTTLGEKLGPADVDKVLKEADSDNNGKINFQDFMKVMKSVKV